MKNKMWEYIDEQAVILNNILKKEKEMLSFVDSNDNISEIIITASGSSLNAAMLVKSLCEINTNIRITVENPFQLNNYSQLLYSNDNKILIGLSQTGKSTGTLNCIKLAKENNIKTISLTACDDSPIALAADYHLNICCGDENVGPKTKGFSATVLVLHLLIMRIIQYNKYEKVLEDYNNSIRELPINISKAKDWCKLHKQWAKAKAMSIVGFGANYPNAREGSLKILETMQISVMNFDLEEFMHGPHRTIVNDSFLIVIDTDGAGKVLMNNLIKFALEKTNNFLIISTIKNDDYNTIRVGNYESISSWLNIVAIFQVMCTSLPEENGINSSDPVYGDFATKVGTRVL